MPKNKLYWKCQLFGWSLWLINDTIFNGPKFQNHIFDLLNILILLGICILVTHQFKSQIKNIQQLNQSIQSIFPKIALVVFLMSLTVTVNQYIIDKSIDFLEININNDISFNFLKSLLYWGKPMIFWTSLYFFYHFFERKSEIEVEKIKLESSIKESEAKILRAQMNPHFMFNALNSIRALIIEDPAKAQKGITQLSNILRSSLLADRRKTVPLSEEMRTVDDYLALEKIRYEERLRIEKDIAPETLSYQIPPMLLQTLVENAIKHGVSKPIKGGFIHLQTYIEQDHLTIKINNTGQLKTTESEGFGLENTAQRLQLIYGASSKFDIEQLGPDVVSATIFVPNLDI